MRGSLNLANGADTKSIDVDFADGDQRITIEGVAVSNRVLLAIPEQEYILLRPHLMVTDLDRHNTLHEANEKLEFVYFPNGGLVSLVVGTSGGKTVEVGVVGADGVVGAATAVGLNSCTHRAVVQVPGKALAVKVEALRSLLPSTPELQALMSRCAVIQGMQAAQTAACNRLHGIEQRLARWLLIMQDRLNSALLPITHECLAAMLGTDRPSVSVGAGNLQRKDLIEISRGAVRILNRKGLERAACECYFVIQRFNCALVTP